MPTPVPGTPRLLRAINDRTALEVLLAHGPLTRPQLGALTGLSKPTASQMLTRLREADLVVLDGIREGGPGRTAELYRINPDAGYVAGLDVTPTRIQCAVADITGGVVGEHRLPTPGRSGGDVIALAKAALGHAAVDVPTDRLLQAVVGVQGAIDPRTGRLGYAAHLPGWHIPNLVERLSAGLGVATAVENDVNLAAVAETTHGEAVDAGGFVLLWVGSGVGLAVMLGGVLHRGATGGAGEVGYMPVAGAPVFRDVGRRNAGGLQSLVGAPAVRRLLRSHGLRGGTAVDLTTRAAAATAEGDQRATAGLDELATRLATGLAAITSVLDPDLIVLTGDVLRAGGEPLRVRVERELHTMTIPHPQLRLSSVDGNPVLTGALDSALDAARDLLFSGTVPPDPHRPPTP